MPDHILNRKVIIEALHDEFVGPAPRGEEIDCQKQISFDNINDVYKAWKQKGSGEEIITRESPEIRYTVGVLFPADITINDQKNVQAEFDLDCKDMDDSESVSNDDSRINCITSEGRKYIEEINKKLGAADSSPVSDDFDISLSNKYRPCSSAISFLAKVGPKSALQVEVTGGRYTKKEVSYRDKKHDWWLRSPLRLLSTFYPPNDHGSRRVKLTPAKQDTENLGDLKISVEVFSRPAPNNDPDSRLFTVCVINRSKPEGASKEYSVFQTSFTATVLDGKTDFNILPYPKPEISTLDEEERALELLYRKHQTFAVGHGCSADWGLMNENSRVVSVRSDCFPMAEIPNITPEVKLQDGQNFSISMAALAGLEASDTGIGSLQKLIELYDMWIRDQKTIAEALDSRNKPAAQTHVKNWELFSIRMKRGLEHLLSDTLSMRAFRMANHAILIQQLRSRRSSRKPEYDSKTKRLIFKEPPAIIDELKPSEGRGIWRPFQIAFILAAVNSIVHGADHEREIVDLIWFPTGGGKTEAYLGLAAFSILLRRLRNPNDSGVEVLMRYTLRLLTAQQFLRASTLICALESLRKKHPDELGLNTISIGVWLGGETTPNTRKEAITELRALKLNKKTDNSFMVERCPWCGALMGPGDYPNRSNKSAPKLLGYEQRGESVVLECPDQSCDFADELPLLVIDEDIYESPPSLIIGTVDKFARLSWTSAARSIFGIDKRGRRLFSPPRLIIQDELHLISGPLGSMVGLYETVIEELCTDRRNETPIKPKIICSTATIRRSANQIKALFGRCESALFPPPGLDAGDSFFASFARDDDGKLCPGKVYLGLLAPSATFDTVTAQTLAALLEAPMSIPKEERDPWWTLVTFYNSLRELGSGLSLLQSYVPDHLKTIVSRNNLSFSFMRRLYNVQELTGRLKSGDVARSIGALEIEVSDQKDPRPIDVCLTSSIMEVGVDIDRLSLMLVAGQPKSTSQYIQITGRVGRKWAERPGLIVTAYPATRPRDRSHFEKFKSYHERLYAQVEPTSVTPFSPPALDRALHAVMAAYALQLGTEEEAESPYPFPERLVENIRDLLYKRVLSVNPDEHGNLMKIFKQRAEEWRRWERLEWTGPLNSEDPPLLREAGAYINPAFAKISWPTPTSMRTVDAECQTEVFRGSLSGEVNNDAA